jgi:hypothetical protein
VQTEIMHSNTKEFAGAASCSGKDVQNYTTQIIPVADPPQVWTAEMCGFLGGVPLRG